MKYGGDKIKLVTNDLKLGDNLQVLGFDTCGFALIGKWKNEYGTYGDPLIDGSAPCGTEGNCPNCQPKISDIKDLPGWPEPCSEGDAFIMMTRSGYLTTLCKDSLIDKDEKVKVSSGDQIPGYLSEKLTICDSDSPLSWKEITAGNNHKLCLKFDNSKINQNFKDLSDTPEGYGDGPSILYSTGSKIDYFKPKACPDQKYAYLVYNSNSGGLESICDPHQLSCCYWEYSGGSAHVTEDADGALYYFRNKPSSVVPTHQTFSGGCRKFSATEDIQLANGDSDTLFVLTNPGVYYFSYGITAHNVNNAGLQAIRSCLLVGDKKLESKYDSRKYTEYVNDFWPEDQDTSYEGGERNLELTIMSFSNSSMLVIDQPCEVQLRLGISRALNDHRMETTKALPQMELEITASGSKMGGATYVSCVRLGDIPPTWDNIIGDNNG